MRCQIIIEADREWIKESCSVEGHLEWGDILGWGLLRTVFGEIGVTGS